MKLRSLLPVLLLIGVVGAVWWMLHPAEPRRILRQLERLADRVSKNESESAAVMALKMNAIGDLFESEVTVELADFPANGTYLSSELASHVARFRPSCRSIALSFHDSRIRIGPPRQAEVTCTARLLVTPTNGEAQSDTRPLRVLLHRDEDKTWRFARFEEVQVLQR